MDILVVGGGGREHAIIWKLAKSPRAGKLYCAPGNGGIARLAQCIGIGTSDIDGIVSFAKRSAIDLVVIGPDDPLALGLADACEAAGIRAFGPCKAGARLEWSKSYAKELMLKHGIPTAGYEAYDNAADALAALAAAEAPYVVKTDGLALGKGVVVTGDRAEAEAAVRSIMVDRVYGDAGARVVLEEHLSGPEMTVLAFTDGNVIKPMVCSQDHKRAFDGDMGPNTGGMGAFAPSPIYTQAIRQECLERIFAPTLDMIKKEGIRYRGVLYFGLMLTESGVKVIEYNARFGDPEAQVVLPLLKNDLLDIIDAVIDGRLADIELSWEDGCAACVIAASGGYPGPYKTGFEVSIAHGAGGGGNGGSDNDSDVIMFHAGTRLEQNRLVTSGGRVLGATALGGTLGAALDRAYSGIKHVSFNDMRFRKDIGGHWRQQGI